MKACRTLHFAGKLLLPGLVLCSNATWAQEADQVAEDLGAITVTSPRVETPLNEVPYAIDLVGKDEIQLATQQLTLDESLSRIPGVFILNSQNFAQDVRIVIRGFGARANFGIRSIKLYADDIPLTTPDGQGGVDNIDLASAERIEVIRGPASSLYGTSSGGVINVITEEGPEIPFVEGRYAGGSYGYHKYNLKTGGQKDDLSYLLNIGRYELDGYRDNSRTESINGNAKLVYAIDETSELTTIINFVDSPVAEDAGGLTLAEVQQDRRQSAPNNLLFNADEFVEQQQIGFVYRKDFSEKHELRLRNYYVFRDFGNQLPFGGPSIVEFNRFFFGGGAQYTYNGDINRLTVGFDVDQQNDNRRRFFGLPGGVQGSLALNQDEDVNSIGFYAQNEQYLTDTITLTTGIRYDEVEFEVNDNFLSDGSDDSGNIKFDEVSPLIGLLWSPKRWLNAYGNISTAFETPSTTEFANPNNAGTAGGFNPNLGPQTATNYEIGVKGFVPQFWGLTYDAAVYYMEVEDELVPFELPGQAGRSFFRNAGESTRQGFELAVSANPMPGLTTSFTYTYTDFEFDRYRIVDATGAVTIFDGNTIPGMPEHLGHISIRYDHPKGFYGIWDTLLVGEYFADDANTTQISGYGVSNLRAGYTGRIGDTEISPFIGINNIFDKEYFSNVRLNAFGGRFFEPAPEINAYAGISIRHDFF